MISYLKQSTAVTILVGPIVDSTDASAETAQTIAQTDVLLWKQGGTGLAAKNESTSATHRSNGLYTVPIDATDTNTLGVLTVNIAKAGTLVWRGDYLVLPANVYDSIVSGSDKLQVDAVELNSVSGSASKLEKAASSMVPGTVDTSVFTSTTTQFEAADITEATADHYKGRIVNFTSGAMAGQSSDITAYSLQAGKGRFTVSTLTEAPANGVTFVIS